MLNRLGQLFGVKTPELPPNGVKHEEILGGLGAKFSYSVPDKDSSKFFIKEIIFKAAKGDNEKINDVELSRCRELAEITWKRDIALAKATTMEQWGKDKTILKASELFNKSHGNFYKSGERVLVIEGLFAIPGFVEPELPSEDELEVKKSVPKQRKKIAPPTEKENYKLDEAWL